MKSITPYDLIQGLKPHKGLELKLKQGKPKWKLKEKPKGIEIQALSIIFKATASDEQEVE